MAQTSVSFLNKSDILMELAGVGLFLLILSLQLFLSVRNTSQTWDEANHIYAGYQSWTHGDFGLNPEHPPLLKFIATAPLFSLSLTSPTLEDRFFKEAAFLGGKDFLYKNDADQILFRSRMAAAILTLLMAVVVYLGTKEMFGTGAAFIALALLTFDPNLLAHGALVTTDAGLACFMFAAVYAFYRYVKAPSIPRLIVAGVVVGLALAVKHTGFLILPILLLLALSEFIRNGIAERPLQRLLKLVGSLAAIVVIGVALLWAFYGFRYAARPDVLQLNPSLADYV